MMTCLLRKLRKFVGVYCLAIPIFNADLLIDAGTEYHTKDSATINKSLGDNDRLELLSRLAKQNSSKTASGQAKAYIAEAFSLAKQKNLKIPYTLFWANAEVLNSQKDYWGALETMDKACHILKGTSKYQETAEALTFYARLLLFTGNFSKSIELYSNVIAMAKEKSLKNIIPDCYRGLCDVYNTVGKTPEERESAVLLAEWARKENNMDYLARAYFRLGQISLSADSNMRESNRYYKEAFKIRQQRGDSSTFPAILNRISWNYYLLHQYDTSLQYYKQTLEVSLRLNNYSTVANSYGNMGTIYRDKKDYEKALYFYGKSNAYAMIVKDWFTISWTSKDMSEMFRSMGDFKKAYECAMLYKQYDDSLSNQKYSVGLADARAKYETDSKAKALELINLKVSQQKYFIFGLSGFILLALLIGFLLFRQSRLNSKRQISEMNRQISEITQANLRQQMNPHFIFNTLNSIQYYMYQHDKLAVNNYLTKFSSLMRKTLENSQHTAIPIKDELEALELYIELESLRFKEKFDYYIQLDEEIDLLLYKIPTMLLQPYVENAIGHGLNNKEGKGKLDVRIELKQDYLCFTIEDNGVGRKEAMRIKQGREKHYPPLGTKITESRMELANAFYGTRMKVQYTDLHDEAGNAAGTRVEIQIPVLT